MKWILFIGLAVNNLMNLGDRPFVFDTKDQCMIEGNRQMQKYATQAALIGTKPVFECSLHEPNPDWER